MEVFAAKKLLNGNSVLFIDNDGEEFADGKDKKQNFRSSHTVAVDPKFQTVLAVTAISLLVYKIYTYSMNYASLEHFSEISKYYQKYTDEFSEWLYKPESQDRIIPVLCGLGIAIFSWILVYMDSNIPGIQPPSPFSPKSKQRYHNQKSSSVHIGYLTSIMSGIVVTALMVYNS